jgi:energy-coupling factor transporter ATP-binding protein EcfA2
MSEDYKITPIRRAVVNAGQARPRNGGGHLPQDCPVVPLGTDGVNNFYLNAGRIYVCVPIKGHTKHVSRGLFAPHESYLRKHWPKTTKNGEVVDFSPDEVAAALINACAVEGAWNGDDRLRGLGAWEGEDGDLVVHLGNIILAGGAAELPGARGRFIYPERAARPAPAKERQAAGADGPGAELLALFDTWTWRRPDLDPLLLAGFVGSAFLCGALRWRPQAWIAGERGSGKSTLMSALAGIMHRGDHARLVADASAASIRAALGHDAVPVLHDEAEPSEDMQRLNAKIDLLRVAASGGQVIRATTDQRVVTQTARFSGVFASVLRPPLKGQDLSRLVFLDLARITAGRPPDLGDDRLSLLGRRVFRRMVDGWPRFREALPAWREAVMHHGMDARGADQYGTLLAAHDVLCHDDAPDTDTLDDLAARVAASTAVERAEERPEWRWCLDHLTSAMAPQWRSGDQRSVGTLVAIAAGRPILSDRDTGEPRRPFREEREDADRVLHNLGLRFEPARDADGRALTTRAGDPIGYLAIANAHSGLSQIFRDTHWKPRSGAAGGWKAAIEHVKDARLGQARRFGGAISRCVLVPIEAVLDGDQAPEP